MDNGRRPSGTGFADEFDEFDHLLDEEEGEAAPTRGRGASTPAGAKRSKPARSRAVGRPSVRVTDWNRFAALMFVVAVVLLVLWLIVSTIMDARRQGAYEDYFRSVREVATESNAQGASFDSILTDPEGGDRAQRIASLERLGARADKLVKRGSGIEAPEQLAEAHDWLISSLEYRAAGIEAVGRALTSSIDSKSQTASSEAVAAGLARLVAADVMWADSFAVASRTQLKADEVEGVSVPDSTFIDDFDSLSPKSIAAMLVRLSVSTSAAPDGKVTVPKDGKVRGGQLESGRITVSPSGQTLNVNGISEIKGGEDVSFEVPFTNQGEVQLTEVPVKITLRGEESDPVTLTGVIDVVDPGQTATTKVAVDEIPNFGEVVEMEVVVGPIPGEKTADNNRATFQLRFSL